MMGAGARRCGQADDLPSVAAEPVSGCRARQWLPSPSVAAEPVSGCRGGATVIQASCCITQLCSVTNSIVALDANE